jgi:hypothetical protein
MNGDTMTATARVLIWVFFLLIATKVVEFLALHGSPIRPIFVYAPLVGVALIVVALCVGRSDTPRIPKAEAYFFFVNLLLAVWILVSPGGYSDYSFRIAMWPLINLLMGGALFYFARYMGLGSTIVNAAIGALVVELLGILADLWMPGTFAEWAARPAGPPQNSNNAGLLVCLLLALLLPVTRGEPVRPASLLALAVSVVGVFVSLSRSGLLMCLGIAVLFIVALARSPMRPRFQRPLFEVCASTVLALVVGTLLFAPALREPDAIAIWRSRIGVAIPDLTLKISGGASKTSVDTTGPSKTTTVSQELLDASIRETDDTILQRENAFKFFLVEAKRRPLLGLGTGYGYLYKRGPHNTFLSLFVEQGVPALLMFFFALSLLTHVAVRRQSIALLAVVSIGWADSMLSHTLLVEPWFLVFACATLGLTAPDQLLRKSPLDTLASSLPR